jgi:hypothetical protein
MSLHGRYEKDQTQFQGFKNFLRTNLNIGAIAVGFSADLIDAYLNIKILAELSK